MSKTCVVSDLHLFCKRSEARLHLEALEQAISESDTCVLNGDIIDNPYRRLQPEDESVLNFLREQSFQRRVVWIFGNHDENFRMPDPGRIEFRRE